MTAPTPIPALCVIVLLGVAVGGYRWATTERVVGGAGEVSELAHRPDPNTATAEELEVVPGIGRTRARALVAYREQRRAEGVAVVFAGPEDLRKVRGFGPATADRAGEFLLFPVGPEP